MQSLLEQFASLDSVVRSAILGALGGVIGSVIVKLGADNLTKTGRNIIYIVCIVLATQLPKLFFPDLLGSDQVSRTIREMQKLRVVEMIFKYYPESKEEVRSALKQAIAAPSPQEKRMQAQTAIAAITAKYVEKSLPNASDERVFFMIRRNAAATKHLLTADPKLCVGMFMGNPQIAPGEFRDKLVKEESDLKGDVVESAFINPSKAKRALTPEEAIQPLSEIYEKKGYNLGDLSKIEIIHTLPPKEGCKIAVEFGDALEALGQEKGVFVFKNLYMISE